MVGSPTSRDSGLPRAVVLTRRDEPTLPYVLSTLSPLVDLRLVIEERGASKWEILKRHARRSRRLGWSYPLDRMLLGVYGRFILRRQAAAHPACKELQNAQRTYRHSCPQEFVETVNAPRVRELLLDLRPDVVLVWGTELIHEHVLEASPLFVNVHAGITPLYRGCHGATWAVVAGDFGNLGVTVHRVDRGIDTGGILKQVRISLEPEDNLVTLLAKQTVAGWHAVAEWLGENKGSLAESPTLSPPAGKSRLYYSPGLSDYLRFERMAREYHRRGRTPDM
jgi:folate-dependent phosphoribosylglycinamide formyltransferase PurN